MPHCICFRTVGAKGFFTHSFTAQCVFVRGSGWSQFVVLLCHASVCVQAIILGVVAAFDVVAQLLLVVL